jgi:hypothetical protein
MTGSGNEEVIDMSETLFIDCDGCVGKEVGACDGCVVSFILGREPGDAVVIDVAEQRAMRLLSNAGMVPPLRYCPTGSDA